MQNLIQHAREQDLHLPDSLTTDYVNTIPVDAQPEYPGDLDLEVQIRNILRWNSAMLVHRAQDVTDLDLEVQVPGALRLGTEGQIRNIPRWNSPMLVPRAQAPRI